MDTPLYTLLNTDIESLTQNKRTSIINNLEKGQVIYLPNFLFTLQEEEMALLTDKLLDGSRKNISYDHLRGKLSAYQSVADTTDKRLNDFMARYANVTNELIRSLIPQYHNELIWGRTSYRPAKISNRALSKKKDDSRLHVDAFPGTPVYGHRILRIFTNINPNDEARVWHLGEPFSRVVHRFSSQLPSYSPLKKTLLYWLKATKKPRSAYDHYMVKLHDHMKLDDTYQKNVPKTRVEFSSGSTWIVFTDQVSHAALNGQYALEQTFYIPLKAMENPEYSPLHHWEKLKSFKLSEKEQRQMKQ